jgi:hypothetical protein
LVLVGAFRVITLLVGAEGSHIDPKKIIEPDRDRTTLFENMPQHDGYPSDGYESDRNDNEIEPAHSLFIQLRPSKLSITY